MNEGAPLLPAELTGHLFTHTVGRRLFYHPETSSTNDVAVAFAKAGEPEGSVVYADFQRAGRGRGDHTWSGAAHRDLLFSMILRPGGDMREILPVTLAVSVAVSVALGKAVDADVGVKWPNDLVVGGRKIAGILAESGSSGDGRYVVVGVGINTNSEARDFGPELADAAVSCRMLAGAPVNRAALLADVLGSIETYYQRFSADGFAMMRSSYEDRLVLMGREVSFDRDGERCRGEVAGVGGDGALRVTRPGGTGEWVLYNETVEVEGS